MKRSVGQYNVQDNHSLLSPQFTSGLASTLIVGRSSFSSVPYGRKLLGLLMLMGVGDTASSVRSEFFLEAEGLAADGLHRLIRSNVLRIIATDGGTQIPIDQVYCREESAMWREVICPKLT